MKQLLRISLCSAAVAICTNFIATGASNEVSTETGASKKQAINFFGTVITDQGKVLSVENISINNLPKKIIVHGVQETPNADREIKGDLTYVTLPKNPKDTDTLGLSLELVASIKVPESSTIYTYHDDEKNTTIDYVRIDVTYKNSTKARQYLIEYKKQLFFLERDVPIPHQDPFTAIKEITIDGYTKREKESTAKANGKKPKKKVVERKKSGRSQQVFKPVRS